MKALVLREAAPIQEHPLELTEVPEPEPEPGPGEVRPRVTTMPWTRANRGLQQLEEEGFDGTGVLDMGEA